MATTNKIKLVNTFADETTRDFELEGFDSDCAVLTPATLKQRIAALNSDTTAFSAFYLSDGGATFDKITGATISKQSETDIPLHTGE